MQKEINTQLQEMAKADPDVAAFFAFLADEKRRHREFNDIRNIVRAINKVGLKMPKDKLLKIFNELQTLGVGRLVMGRGRTPSRFYWDEHKVEIGKAAHGKAIIKQQTITEDTVDNVPSFDSIIIRKGDVEITIPASASDKELETVVRILDKLEAVH